MGQSSTVAAATVTVRALTEEFNDLAQAILPAAAAAEAHARLVENAAHAHLF